LLRALDRSRQAGTDRREAALLAQFNDSASALASVLGWVFALASVAWFVFVVWWMVTIKNEIQRIRMTFEHQVYDFDHDEDE
jgi:hypothetical protein